MEHKRTKKRCAEISRLIRGGSGMTRSANSNLNALLDGLQWIATKPDADIAALLTRAKYLRPKRQ
jgi:hypothetical protein